MQPTQSSIASSTTVTTGSKRLSSFQKRSVVRQHWGILFAILVFLVTTLLSLEHLPAQTNQRAQTESQRTENLPARSTTEENVSTEKESSASTVRSGEPALTFEDIDFNRGWRKGKSGWVRIQQYRVEPAIPLNIIQKISPIFWGLCLWMFAILLLVMAS